MKSAFACFAFVVLAGSFAPAATAADVPSPHGDPKAGEKLFNDKNCNVCHIQRFGGTGEEMFTRANHKVTTIQKLNGQVAACNTNLNAGWFPEDEENVAAYLNQKYYKLK
jgi:mono/diheme cytochrome c family protein